MLQTLQYSQISKKGNIDFYRMLLVYQYMSDYAILQLDDCIFFLIPCQGIKDVIFLFS